MAWPTSTLAPVVERSSRRVDLSVVIPAYNERERLPRTLEAIGSYLQARGGKSEVIVVDDGSRDGTAEAAAAEVAGLRERGVAVDLLRHAENRGKGAAVRTGFAASSGEVVLFSDSDLSTPIEDTERLLEAIRGGADVAIGSRAVEHRRLVEKHQPWRRELMGRVFNLLVQAVLLPGLHDTQCGFKAFTGDAGRRLLAATRSDGFEFDVEVLYRARRARLRIAEVAVRWRHAEGSRVSAVRDSARMFLALFRIRRQVG